MNNKFQKYHDKKNSLSNSNKAKTKTKGVQKKQKENNSISWGSFMTFSTFFNSSSSFIFASFCVREKIWYWEEGNCAQKAEGDKIL